MKSLFAVLGVCVLLCSCVPQVLQQQSESSSAAASSMAAGMTVQNLRLLPAPGDIMDSYPLIVEIASTPGDRDRGLMYRTSLPENHGMLFVFEKPQELFFWMKNTKIPLEVLYFEAQGKFVSMQSMIPCTADPCPSYPSHGLAQYALEVNAGFSHRYNVGAGWSIDYVRDE